MSASTTPVRRGGRVVAFSAERENQHTAHVGMVVFLAGWAMMFAALFFSYAMLRMRAPEWPPAGTPALPLLLPCVATAVILGSSAALHFGLRAVRREKAERAWRLVLTSAILAAAFLAVQVASWGSLWEDGLRLSGRFGGIFYLLTVFHGLHVVVGLGVLGWLVRAVKARRLHARSHAPLDVMALFWHFVGAAWVLVFVSLYLL